MSPILRTESLSVSYGRVEAVRGASIEIPAGGVVTVIGANGAGKTSLLNAIMGVLPSTGAVAFDGRALGRTPIEERVAGGLSLVPEKRELFASMSVEDNLRLGGYRLGGSAIRAGLGEIYGRFPRLRERRDQMAGTLSGGERQMLAMGRALMGRPRVLMLDEPSLGLAPRIVKEIFQIVAELRRTGVAILLVEQNARAALAIADWAYVMELGEIVIQGPAAELADDRRVIESYLGLPAMKDDRRRAATAAARIDCRETREGRRHGRRAFRRTDRHRPAGLAQGDAAGRRRASEARAAREAQRARRRDRARPRGLLHEIARGRPRRRAHRRRTAFRPGSISPRSPPISARSSACCIRGCGTGRSRRCSSAARRS